MNFSKIHCLYNLHFLKGSKYTYKVMHKNSSLLKIRKNRLIIQVILGSGLYSHIVINKQKQKSTTLAKYLKLSRQTILEMDKWISKISRKKVHGKQQKKPQTTDLHHQIFYKSIISPKKYEITFSLHVAFHSVLFASCCWFSLYHTCLLQLSSLFCHVSHYHRSLFCHISRYHRSSFHHISYCCATMTSLYTDSVRTQSACVWSHFRNTLYKFCINNSHSIIWQNHFWIWSKKISCQSCLILLNFVPRKRMLLIRICDRPREKDLDMVERENFFHPVRSLSFWWVRTFILLEKISSYWKWWVFSSKKSFILSYCFL